MVNKSQQRLYKGRVNLMGRSISYLKVFPAEILLYFLTIMKYSAAFAIVALPIFAVASPAPAPAPIEAVSVASKFACDY